PLSRREFVLAAGAVVLTPYGPVRPVGPWRELEQSVRGPLLSGGHAGYAAVAHGYNERWDGRLPRAVLIAHDVADVQAAVRWAAARWAAGWAWRRGRSGSRSIGWPRSRW